MLLWTIVPLEQIFNNVPDTAQLVNLFEDIEFRGVKLEVQEISPSEKRIVRIISSNPKDFLRPEIQPGMVLSYKLTQKY